MINHLHLESFKCFSSYDVEFKQIQLLIGGNNSGKTTIFQALQVFFWCLDQTADVTDAAPFLSWYNTSTSLSLSARLNADRSSYNPT